MVAYYIAVLGIVFNIRLEYFKDKNLNLFKNIDQKENFTGK